MNRVATVGQSRLRFVIAADGRVLGHCQDAAAHLSAEWRELAGRNLAMDLMPDLNRTAFWSALAAAHRGRTAVLADWVWHRADTVGMDLHLTPAAEADDAVEVAVVLRDGPVPHNTVTADLSVAPTPTMELAAQKQECAGENLTHLGRLQAHGTVLAFDEAGRLTWRGANAAEILGPGAAQIATLADLVDAATPIADTRQALQAGASVPEGFEVLAHARDGQTIVEVVRPAAQASADVVPHVARLLAADGEAAARFALVHGIREITGYERVLLYLFEAEGHGVPVAESKVPDWDDGLYQRWFPATDVPEQARRLYLTSGPRQVRDIDAASVALDPVALDSAVDDMGPTAPPPSLAGAALRAQSEAHLRYVRAMGVRAACGVSVVDDGQLTGLIIAHSRTPHGIAQAVEAACALLVDTYRAIRDRLADRRALAEQAAARADLERLMQQAGLDLGPRHLFRDHGALAGRMMRADGVAWIDAEGAICSGTAPTPRVAAALAAHLRAESAAPVIALATLKDLPPRFADIGSGIAGVLMARIPGHRGHAVVWFRRATRRTLSWAGNPQVPMTRDAEGRLIPREDWSDWFEQRVGYAEEWSDGAEFLALETVGNLAAALDRNARAVDAEERRIRDFAAASADMFIETDVTGSVQYIDSAPSYGKPIPPALRVGSLTALIAALPLEQQSEVSRQLAARAPILDLEVDFAAGGERTVLRLSGVPYATGTGTHAGYRWAARDITERWQLEDEFRLIRAAVDVSSEAILITDADIDEPGPRIVYCNPAFCAQTGYAKSDIVGRSPRFLQGPETASEATRTIRGAMLAGQPVTVDLVNYRKDGTAVPIELAIAPVRDRFGTVTNFVSVQHDLTQRLAEQRRTDQAQRMEAIGRLAGGVAHDFNNLMAVVLGYVALLEEADLGAEQLGWVERIAAAAQRGGDLTQHLLSFSRRRIQDARPVPLNAAVNDLVRLIGRVLPDDIEIAADTAADDPVVAVDPAQLDTALLNLCLNARDAMPSGGRLALAVRADAERVTVSVRDTGEGIPADIVDKVTEPFFTTKPDGLGSGLGLSMIDGFMAQSGGTLGIDSVPGVGTTITLSFPRHRTPTARTQEAAPTPTRRLPKHVLLIEDDVELNALIQQLLTAQGCEVAAYRTSRDALAALGPAPDVMVSDLSIPGDMNGAQLLDALRCKWSDRQVPGLIISGYPDLPSVGGSQGTESWPVLPKPFRPQALLDALSALVGPGSAGDGGEVG